MNAHYRWGSPLSITRVGEGGNRAAGIGPALRRPRQGDAAHREGQRRALPVRATVAVSQQLRS